ncbi:MAG: hypothetical protein Greene041619_74 [Candidatus Peregrinibacteria bacterium Greene0416_19]|nr:MAG: hypothetical protein Greene041619_74 [Candidatus Peregrinibacteria bacterium Greene0416_19]
MSVIRRFGRLFDRRRLADDLAVLWDYLSFRWKVFFLHQSRSAGNGKKILIVSLTDWVAQVKMEGVFGKALELDGSAITVLTDRTNKRAQLYFRSMGIDQFVFLDDLMDQHASRVPQDRLEAALRSSTFHEFMRCTHRGVRVGKHTLSTIVRRLRQGSVAFDDPEAQQLLRGLLPRSFQAAEAAHAFFDAEHTDVVLFLEKGYSPYAEVFDAALAHGCPCIQYVHAHTRDSMFLKRYTLENADVHAASVSPSAWERIKRLPWTAETEESFIAELRRSYAEGTWFNRKFLLEGKKLKNPDAVRSQLGLDPAKKTVVIFSHVLWDATFFYGTNLFEDYEKWLIETVKVACGNDRVNWVIKLHPDYVWKMKQLGITAQPRDVIALDANFATLPPHITVVAPDTDISTYSFFAITDYCITVRGTIGIEAPCFGIPVLTAGTGRYSGLGFTNDSASSQEYLEKLRRIEDIPLLTPEETTLARRHAHALFRLRPLTFHTWEMVQSSFSKLGHPLDQNVILRAASLPDLAAAPDLRAFRDWVLRSQDEDYLASH